MTLFMDDPRKDSTGGGDVDYDNDQPERLNINSTLVEIADAMKTTGLNFVNKAVQGMPPSTFLAFEAVNWIMENIRGKYVYYSSVMPEDEKHWGCQYRWG